MGISTFFCVVNTMAVFCQFYHVLKIADDDIRSASYPSGILTF